MSPNFNWMIQSATPAPDVRQWSKNDETGAWEPTDAPVILLVETLHAVESGEPGRPLKTRTRYATHRTSAHTGHHDPEVEYGHTRWVRADVTPTWAAGWAAESDDDSASAELLELFADERLVRTGPSGRGVRLSIVFDAYLAWCAERRVKEAHRLSFVVFLNHLAELGYRRSEEARPMIGGGYEYVLEHATLV